jgi:hypothetical protein
VVQRELDHDHDHIPNQPLCHAVNSGYSTSWEDTRRLQIQKQKQQQQKQKQDGSPLLSVQHLSPLLASQEEILTVSPSLEDDEEVDSNPAGSPSSLLEDDDEDDDDDDDDDVDNRTHTSLSTITSCRTKKSVTFDLDQNTIHDIIRPSYVNKQLSFLYVFDDDDDNHAEKNGHEEDQQEHPNHDTMRRLLWYSPYDLLLIRLREYRNCMATATPTTTPTPTFPQPTQALQPSELQRIADIHPKQQPSQHHHHHPTLSEQETMLCLLQQQQQRAAELQHPSRPFLPLDPSHSNNHDHHQQQQQQQQQQQHNVDQVLSSSYQTYCHDIIWKYVEPFMSTDPNDEDNILSSYRTQQSTIASMVDNSSDDINDNDNDAKRLTSISCCTMQKIRKEYEQQRGLERWYCPQFLSHRSFYKWFGQTVVLLEQSYQKSSSQFYSPTSEKNHHTNNTKNDNNKGEDQGSDTNIDIATLYHTYSRPSQQVAYLLGHMDRYNNNATG